jgi:uncharacterized protein (TIGR02466 family)
MTGGPLHAAMARLQAGDAAGALEACDAVLSRAPGDAEARHLRAITLGRLERADEAEADFRAAAAVHPQPGVVLCNLGNMLRRFARLDAAAAAYREAAEAAPDHAPAWFGLGLILSDLGREVAAEQAFETVLTHDPAHSGALNGLGLIAAGRGEDGPALARFEAALAANPQSAAALSNRGDLRRRGGALEDGLADLRAAARLAPGNARVQHHLANTLRDDNLPDEAQAAFAAAFRSGPYDPDLHADYARFRWEQGDGAGFLSVIDAALAQRNDPALHLTKSRLAVRAGLLDIAEAAADAAVAGQPGEASALAARGQVRALEDRLDEAVQDLRAAFEAAPENFEIRQDYAETLLSAHRFEEAAAALDCAAPDEHLQRHVALQTLAWRGAGDPDYARFCDYDRFVFPQRIRTPAGYDSLEAFNAALAAALETLHAGNAAHPIDQTLYNGTQSTGRLWDCPLPEVQALKESLLEAADAYLASLPDDPDHPFLRRKTGRVRLAGAWSVRLRSGGGHVDHMHPAGWISASYYVSVPPSVGADGRAGCIRFGASGVRGLDMPAERWVKPEAGLAVFFPSYLWHGVEPFQDEAPRITAPFDLLPV